ncbi:chloride channel protein [Mangrovihabitans endophyticus]|uniref:Transport integral membrane protein n=1 Tax=Mangrovihabitans endophyticus TaxID=1751298 RepID=A0A8J3C043_9ACTN|nr:chloride channel protein [Mangrovihabitans endophyticus]GGK99815.1 transport integral membrane protein [Mangrovihabitans endophyticus]
MHRNLSPARWWAWLRGTTAGLQLLAVAVGFGAALGAAAFRWLIAAATRLFSGHDDYAAVAGAANPLLPSWGRWFLLLVPVVAGLIYGPLVYAFAREARGHGVPEVMYAVAERGGRIRPQVAVVKALASAVCIGGGGSVGREGPIVQIGSALGSSLGQLVRLPESRLRILVACGAAGGIAATFNTPIAGVFFALELILADFAVESFAAVVLAAVAASALSRAAFGDHPFLTLPAFSISSGWEYLSYAVLGLLAAGAGVGFSRVLYFIEDLCDRLWRGPEWLRPAVGGLLLGGFLLVLPQMYGVGYPVLGAAVDGGYTIGFLLILLVGKMVATSLTIGIGGSGGVFAPSLFIGGMLGEAFGLVLHSINPALAGTPGAFALVGMGAAFAGAARTPLTAVLIMFELTGEYTIILPLMLAIALSAGVSKLISKDTIYTRKLVRRGIDLHAPDRTLARVPISSATRPVPPPLDPDASLEVVTSRFAEEEGSALPVVGDDGELLGIVLAIDVERAVQDEAEQVCAADLARSVPILEETRSLDDALSELTRHGGAGLPVRDATGCLSGWLTHRDLLRAAAGARRAAR